jgi:hypothetical protein
MRVLKYIGWPKPGWWIFHGVMIGLFFALGAVVKFGG